MNIHQDSMAQHPVLISPINIFTSYFCVNNFHAILQMSQLSGQHSSLTLDMFIKQGSLVSKFCVNHAHYFTVGGSTFSTGNMQQKVDGSGVPRGGLGCSTPPPQNSEGPPKSCQTQPDLWKLLKIAEFRTPTPEDVRKKGSKILTLPRFAIVLQ